MTSPRAFGAAAVTISGLIVLLIAAYSGPPLSNVASAGPALGVAFAVLIIRSDIVNTLWRDALGLIAATAFAGAAIAGFHALWAALVYLWGVARAAGSDGAPLATLMRFQDIAATAWAGQWLMISLWGAVALLPLLGALAVGVPILKRLMAGSRDVEGGPWGARWMTHAEASYLARQKTGLPLGRLGGKLLRYRDDADRGWRGGHHMLISGTRGGKGVSGVLPAIIDHDGPVVALDVKAELFAITRRHRQSLGQRVIVLNPLGRVEPSADRFNPLDYVRSDPDHITADAEVIADGLVIPEGDSGSHFYIMARNLVAAAIEVVVKATEGEPERRNLNTVADILSSPDLEDRLIAWRDAGEDVSLPAARAAAAILSAGDKERGSILTTVSKAFAWTSSPPMRRFLEASDFDLDELLAGTTDVFLVVPVDQLARFSVFLRLLVNIVAGVAMRDMGRRNLARPLLLVLDEFARLGRMQKLVDVATVAAGAGIEALFVTQDRAQISSVYRDGEADTLLGSCATVRVFNLGRTDNKTAEWVAAGIGDRTVRAHNQKLEGKKNESGTEQRTKLLAVDQILELPSTDMLALFSGRPPLRLKRIISHSDPAYRDKLDPNPTIRKA